MSGYPSKLNGTVFMRYVIKMIGDNDLCGKVTSASRSYPTDRGSSSVADVSEILQFRLHHVASVHSSV